MSQKTARPFRSDRRFKYEYFRFRDRQQRVDRLEQGCILEKDRARITILRKEKRQVPEIYHPSSPSIPQSVVVLLAEVRERGGKTRRVWISFRLKSRIAVIGTNADIIAADTVYRILTDDLCIELDPLEPGRDKVKEFMSKVTQIELKLETWRGPTDIDDITDFEGDPLLCYSLSLARIQLDCNGKPVITFTLDSIEFEDEASDEERECVFQAIERHLVAPD